MLDVGLTIAPGGQDDTVLHHCECDAGNLLRLHLL